LQSVKDVLVTLVKDVLGPDNFSRAVTEAGKLRALAPEGVVSGKQKTVMKQLLEMIYRR
jgi:hypothetical protein